MAPAHAFSPVTPTQDSAQQCTVDSHPKPEPQAPDPTGHTLESELFWCPWLYSEVSITEHPSGFSPDTCLLPPYPHCPGPLLESLLPPVNRPSMSHGFAQDHPDLALIYKAVQSAGVPNYRGAHQPVPYNINISAWRTRSHLFHDPSLWTCWNLGTQHLTHRLRTQATTPQQTSIRRMSLRISLRSYNIQPSSGQPTVKYR